MVTGELLFLAWLLTYAIHSTILLGGTWLAMRAFPNASMRLRDVMWKLALVGAPLSASFQLATEREPLGGNWKLSAPATQFGGRTQDPDAAHVAQIPSAGDGGAGFSTGFAGINKSERSAAGQDLSESLADSMAPVEAVQRAGDSLSEAPLALHTLPSFERRQPVDERSAGAGSRPSSAAQLTNALPERNVQRAPTVQGRPELKFDTEQEIESTVGAKIAAPSATSSRKIAPSTRKALTAGAAAPEKRAALELGSRVQRAQRALDARPRTLGNASERSAFPVHLVHGNKGATENKTEHRASEPRPVAGVSSHGKLAAAERAGVRSQSIIEGSESPAQELTAKVPQSIGILGYLERLAVQHSPRVLALWIAAALMGALLVSISIGRLRRRLRSREVIASGPLFDALEQLRIAAGLRVRVRLSVSKQLMAPITMGVLRPEICLPPRALDELEPAQLNCILAHELGHIARRDPLWLMISSAVQWCFFFQPLNRLARLELEEAAEFLADDWAVRHTRTGLDLASSLTRVASWIVGARPLPASSMTVGVTGGSRLRRRVERLIHARADAPTSNPSKVSVLALAGPLLVAWAVPGVSATAFSEPTDSPIGALSADSESRLARATGALAAPSDVRADSSQSRADAPAPEPALAPLSAPFDVAQDPVGGLAGGAPQWPQAQPAGAPTQLLHATLRMLDAETEWLESELVQLRISLAGLEEHQELLASLESVEARVERLKSRRARLEQLLPEIANIVSAKAGERASAAKQKAENARADIPMGSFTR